MKILALILTGLATLAVSAEPTHYVYKLDSRPASNLGLKRHTFGLTEKQVEQIRDLTNGQVDFGNVFSSPVPLQDSIAYGVVHANIPPPALQKRVVAAGEEITADPELVGQWWIENLGVPTAWTMATGLGITIADCDAGYYHDELDLKSNILIDLREDFADQDEANVVNDGGFIYHGTAVAAIMVGVQDTLGTNGIAFNSKLVPLQNYNYDSSDDLDKEEATARCILKATSLPDVDIIVLENQTASGSSETYGPTRDAVRLAIQAGIVVVGAGGNYSKELLAELADDTGSIIVGALRPNGSSESWSNFGERVTVGAYGEGLHTLYGPNGQFGEFGGTSGATPQVAATVALMKEVNPLLTPQQMREILQSTRSINETNRLTGGLLSTIAAVNAAKSTAGDVQRFAEQQLFRQRLNVILR